MSRVRHWPIDLQRGRGEYTQQRKLTPLVLRAFTDALNVLHRAELAFDTTAMARLDE